MNLTFIRTELSASQIETKDFLQQQSHKPKIFSLDNLRAFFNTIPNTASLTARNPDILFFVLLQLVTMYVAYLAWVNIFLWIPDSFWNALVNSTDKKTSADIGGLIFFLWSTFIMIIVSYPLSLCNAAMVALYNLRQIGQRPTVIKCFGIAMQHMWKIWLFSIVDNQITTEAIAARLPSKHYHRTALDEALYYAWKLSTMMVIPALINGKGWIDAGKDSIAILKKNPLRAMGLRFGYSAICWIVGILGYLGTIFYLSLFGSNIAPSHSLHWMYQVYSLFGVPIFITVGIITVVIRPFYFMNVCKLYAESVDVAAETQKDIAVLFSWKDFIFKNTFILFLVFVIFLSLIIIFAHDLNWVIPAKTTLKIPLGY